MLVHRMVKNVKDSKVLEKIRTRDKIFTSEPVPLNIAYNYGRKDAELGHGKEENPFKQGSEQHKEWLKGYEYGMQWKKTKDMKVTITIEDEKDIVEPAPEELIPFEGENYKGFEIKQDEGTGEFDVYAPGGALVAHTDTLVLAHDYIDSVDVGV